MYQLRYATCEKVFNAHLDQPVAGYDSKYGHCCPLTFVLRELGANANYGVGWTIRTVRQSDGTYRNIRLSAWARRFVNLVDRRTWTGLTGRVALELLHQAKAGMQ